MLRLEEARPCLGGAGEERKVRGDGAGCVTKQLSLSAEQRSGGEYISDDGRISFLDTLLASLHTLFSFLDALYLFQDTLISSQDTLFRS